jgi:hypothetical protein
MRDLRKRLITAALVAGALVAASPALAAGPAKPKATIDSPAAGATVDRSAGTLQVAGTTGFVTPVPTERDVFIRNTSGTDNCFDPGQMYLGDSDGPDSGNGCSFTFGTLSATGLEEFSEVYELRPGAVALPLTLDASRNIEGQLSIVSVTPNAYIADVTVTINGQALPKQTIDPGPAVYNWLLDGGTAHPLSIDIPDSLDKVDVTTASVTVTWRRQLNVAGSVWTELEDPASFLTIPAYSQSFAPGSVEVTVDDPSFNQPEAALAATVNESADRYTAGVDVSSLAPGEHTIAVRSVQGFLNGTIAKTTITVT